MCNECNFEKYIKNITNRINSAKIKYKINFKKLKKVYVTMVSKNQIQFVSQDAMIDFIILKTSLF